MTRLASVRTIERGPVVIDTDEIAKVDRNWAGPRFGARPELRNRSFPLMASVWFAHIPRRRLAHRLTAIIDDVGCTGRMCNGTPGARPFQHCHEQ